MSATVSNSVSYQLNIYYPLLARLVQVPVVIWQKLTPVLVTVPPLLTGLLRGHPCLLLLNMSDKFNWVSAPHLHRWNQSSGWNHAVWRNNCTFLNDGTFQNDRVVSNVCLFLQNAWIQSASMLNDNIILNFDVCRKTWCGRCSGMEHAIVANEDVGMNPWWVRQKSYITALISPLMTVPCQTVTWLPKNT